MMIMENTRARSSETRTPRPVTPLFTRTRKEPSIQVDLASGSFRIPARFARGIEHAHSWSILVDLVKKEIRTPTTTIDLRAKERLVAMLSVMLESRGRGLSMRELYERAWGMRWKDMETHGAVVTFSLHRLRQLFRDLGAPQLLSLTPEEGYGLRLAPDHVAIRPEAGETRRDLEGLDSRGVVRTLMKKFGFVNNRLLRSEVGWSRSFANRLLVEMVKEGEVEGRGRGRAVHYVAA